MTNASENINNIKQSGYFPICNDCQNKLNGIKCKAFDEIPDDILFGKSNHNVTIEGQNGNFIYKKKAVK